MAKPVMDILVEVPCRIDWSLIKDTMKSNGYICMSVKDIT